MTVSPPLNPILMELSGNGSLAGRDRAGAFTATGSGALRYAPAPGARTNWCMNARVATIVSPWVANSGPETLTRVLDGRFAGGTALRIVNSASGSGAAQTPNVYNWNSALGFVGATYATVSFDVIVESGKTTGNAATVAVCNPDNTGGVVVGSGAWSVSNVGVLERKSIRVTLNQSLVAAGFKLYISITTGTVSDTVFLVSNVVVESGDVPNATYFENPTGWLDPITGQLATAHASPSVSRAVFWVEEATTNLVGEPSAETTVSGYAPQGAGTTTVTRDTTRAYLGAASAKVVCDGTASIQGLNVGSSGLGLTMTARTFCGSIYLCGSGTVNVWTRLGYSDASVDNGTATLVTLTSAWQRIVPAPITANPAKQLSGINIQVRTNSAQAVTFWADCVQAEEKAYATSYCDGSLGTGYTWAGTAHASASSRATAQVLLTNTGRVNAKTGSAVTRFQRSAARVGVLLLQGSSGSGDFINHYLNANGTIVAYTRQGTNPIRQVGSASSAALGTFDKSYAGWSLSTVEAGILSGAIASNSRVDTITQDDLGANTSLVGSDGANLVGLIGPVVIYDQPLSAARRALVNTAIDSNGATDLWTLFEEWEAVGLPLDTVALQAGQATAGVKAVALPLETGVLQDGRATAGVTAVALPMEGVERQGGTALALDAAKLIPVLDTRPIIVIGES